MHASDGFCHRRDPVDEKAPTALVAAGGIFAIGHAAGWLCYRREDRTMYQWLPGGTLDGAIEIVCYVCTVVAAVASYLLTLRL